ncbi:MAG: methylated-DNA--[protein]-cysteine S-methyltransferase [Sulfurovum sp.]|nr:methylated-DNA--[protein]-cysteine S-methyltransferase [Sulfurovum sp.]
MNKIKIQYFKTPIGEMILGAYGHKLCMADWRYRKGRESIDRRVQKGLNAIFIEEESMVLNLAKEELEAYFKGLRKTFNIPFLLVGTEFQKSVWNGLLEIPCGTTGSYLDLAKSIKNEKAVRAVASAVGANAISIFIPCHRIIGSDGSLTGYAGGLESKKKLLALEQNMFTI